MRCAAFAKFSAAHRKAGPVAEATLLLNFETGGRGVVRVASFTQGLLGGLGLGLAPLTRAAIASTLPISLELHRDEVAVREHICSSSTAAATATTATSTTVTASAAVITTVIIGCQPAAVCHEFIVRPLLDDAAAAQDHDLVRSLHRKEKGGCSMEQNDKAMEKNMDKSNHVVFRRAAGRRHCSLSTLRSYSTWKHAAQV